MTAEQKPGLIDWAGIGVATDTSRLWTEAYEPDDEIVQLHVDIRMLVKARFYEHERKQKQRKDIIISPETGRLGLTQEEFDDSYNNIVDELKAFNSPPPPSLSFYDKIQLFIGRLGMKR